jgi:hypothetical protein
VYRRDQVLAAAFRNGENTMPKMDELFVSTIERRAKKGIFSKRKSKEMSKGEREQPKFLVVIPDELCEFMRDKKKLTWEEIRAIFAKTGSNPAPPARRRPGRSDRAISPRASLRRDVDREIREGRWDSYSDTGAA